MESQPPPGEGRPGGPWRTLAGDVLEGSPAAVLVALFEEAGDTRVILTVRSDHLRSHQGEVAFPGGRLDAGEGVAGAALREAFEEVSLDPGLVDVVGELTPMPTRSSNTIMTPVVATLKGRPSLEANPGEVERVFDVALSDLAADGAFHEEWWSVRDRPTPPRPPAGEFPVWFFAVAGETVWGATARTLVELLCLVLGVERAPVGARDLTGPSRRRRPSPRGSGGIVGAVGRPQSEWSPIGGSAELRPGSGGHTWLT